jgi:hypothetical protein
MKADGLPNTSNTNIYYQENNNEFNDDEYTFEDIDTDVSSNTKPISAIIDNKKTSMSAKLNDIKHYFLYAACHGYILYLIMKLRICSYYKSFCNSLYSILKNAHTTLYSNFL